MKKNIITIIIAVIIASFTTTYAQTFHTDREWVHTPLGEREKMKRTTGPSYMRALMAAHKAQDTVMEDTLLRINTSNTIRTLEIIKWLSGYIKIQQTNAEYYGRTNNRLAINMCRSYLIVVLLDYYRNRQIQDATYNTMYRNLLK